MYREGKKKENVLPQTKVSTRSSSFKLQMVPHYITVLSTTNSQ